MATIDSELLHLDNTIENANIVKSVVLARLYKDGHIPERTYEIYMDNWQVLAIKRGWFRRWLNKFRPKDDPETYQYIYVQFEDVELESISQQLEAK